MIQCRCPPMSQLRSPTGASCVDVGGWDGGEALTLRMHIMYITLLQARESSISSDPSCPAVWSVVRAPGLIAANRVHGLLLSRDVVGVEWQVVNAKSQQTLGLNPFITGFPRRECWFGRSHRGPQTSNADSEGIRTPAGRAPWISIPSP